MNPDVWSTPLPDKCVPGPASALYGPDRISKNVYDAAGRLTESWDGIGTPLARREALYAYNGNDRKTSLTDARGYRAEMIYDGHGRQQRWVFPSKSTPGVADAGDYEQYLYDPNGNRTSLRKRDGSVLGFQYDALNRMTAKIVPERSGLTAAQTRDVYYDYDLSGLQTKARFDHIGGEGVTTAYDGFGRVSASTLAMAGTSRTIGHQYDGEGNRTRITHPDGAFFPYDYDGLGRFLRVGENGPDPLVAFTYDPAGRRSGLASGGMSSAFAHDPAGRPVSLAHDLAGTSGDQVIGLGYNPASQIVSRTGTNDAFAWTGAVAVNRPYAVNGLNQYSSAGASTFGYDPNGNLIAATQPPYTSNYVYDVENRLVSASGAQTAFLVYDPLGRLFQTSGGPAGVTRFLYDDDALIAEYNSAGTMVHRYIHGALKGVDDPLIWYDNQAAGWRRPLIADQQGSIVAIADMHGNPIAINAYDEYGIPKFGNVGRFQYTGQAWIPELGMYHYKSRLYSPTLGRFMQVDTIGYEGGINLYGYVDSDPLNHVDPTGKCFWDACIAEGYTAVVVVGAIIAVGVAIVASNNQRPRGDGGTGGDGRRLSRNDNGGPPPDDRPPLPVATPTDRIADQQLSPRTLQAARDELRGRTVATKHSGQAFDHVKKVQNAQTGLYNRIGQIKNRLGHPRLSQAERRSLAAELSKASRKLDESRRYVP